MFKAFSTIQSAIDKGKKVADILQCYLDNIQDRHGLNVFVEVFEESAVLKANEVDDKIIAGTAGKLAGLVVAIEDTICYKGHQVSGASKMLDGFESVYSATVVERLLAEDAVIIGRLNCDEFAMGVTGTDSIYGSIKNPLNEDFSSLGTAAAVAGCLCAVAIGNDVNGGVRLAASYTGTVGFKPSYGRVSRHGLIAYASSFDQIGVVANAIEDVALVMEIIAGQDEFDSTLKAEQAPELTIKPTVDKLRIAYFKELFEEGSLDSEVKERLERITRCLKAEGHDVQEVSFPYLEQMPSVQYTLTSGEASSNLSRYDGIHFGYRSENTNEVEEVYVDSRTEGFGTDVKERIMAGTLAVSKHYYDDFYLKAQKVRRVLQEKTDGILEDCDVILLPSTPSTAFRFDEVNGSKEHFLDLNVYAIQANLTGLPAFSLPLGQHTNGMPFGLQVLGKRFKEGELLNASSHLIDIC